MNNFFLKKLEKYRTVYTHGMYLKCFNGRAQSSLSDLQECAIRAVARADRKTCNIRGILYEKKNNENLKL